MSEPTEARVREIIINELGVEPEKVKAWRGELDSVHREAAWFLYARIWNWAADRSRTSIPMRGGGFSTA